MENLGKQPIPEQIVEADVIVAAMLETSQQTAQRTEELGRSSVRNQLSDADRKRLFPGTYDSVDQRRGKNKGGL